jgi:hypothetical protein
MSDFNEIVRLVILQVEPRIESGALKTRVRETSEVLRQAEREFPSLGDYLQQSHLTEMVQGSAFDFPKLLAALRAFMQHDRALVRQLESIFTIDGQGRPAKARKLLTLIETVEGATLKEGIAQISQRLFL